MRFAITKGIVITMILDVPTNINQNEGVEVKFNKNDAAHTTILWKRFYLQERKSARIVYRINVLQPFT